MQCMFKSYIYLIKIYLVGVSKVISLMSQLISKILLIVLGQMTLQSSLIGMVLMALVLIVASEKQVNPKITNLSLLVNSRGGFFITEL